MIIVTGSNGFIGSNLIKGLNSMGIKDILAVDDHEKLPPSENLSNCEFKDLIEIDLSLSTTIFFLKSLIGFLICVI